MQFSIIKQLGIFFNFFYCFELNIDDFSANNVGNPCEFLWLPVNQTRAENRCARFEDPGNCDTLPDFRRKNTLFGGRCGANDDTVGIPHLTICFLSRWRIPFNILHAWIWKEGIVSAAYGEIPIWTRKIASALRPKWESPISNGYKELIWTENWRISFLF